jgi:diguanylate cyclase (GGDEF)-like protein/PAS domain S-box-containing protein
MPTRVSKSLQVRVTLAIVLLILAGLAALAVFVAGRQEQRLKELLSGQQFSTVGYVAEDIDAKIRLRVDSLVRIALRMAEVPLNDELRLERFLAERQTIYDLFELGLVVVRPDLSGAFADFPALPGRRSSHFRLSPFSDVARDLVPAIGPPGKARHANRPVVVMAVPVKDREGRLIAILAGVTTIDASNFLDLVAKQRLGRSSDFLVIAPRHGMIVTGTEPDSVLKPLPAPGMDRLLDRFAAGFEGSDVGISAEGIEELASARRIPSAGWSVVAMMPTSEAFAPVREFNRLAIGGAAGLSVLVGLIAALFLRRALAPLKRAALSLDNMTRGNEPLRALPIEREDEVGRLVESFNRLQQSLNREQSALRESEEKLRSLLQAIPDSVQFKDHDGNWLEYNIGAQRAFGLEGIDCHGKNEQKLAESAPPAARKALLQCHLTDEIAWRAGQSCRVDEVVHLPDGTTRVFDVIKVPLFHDDGRRKGIVVIGRDITENRRASEALKRSLKEFNQLVERIPVGVYKLRMCPDGSERFDYVSPRWCELVGISAEEVYRDANAASARIHPDDRESMRERNQRARETLDPFQWEGRVGNDKDGVRWLHIESTPTVLSNGDILWEGIQYDVSERRRAEQSLQLVASVFRHAREGICITDAGEHIVDVNPTFCEMTGYSREEVVGKTPRMLKSGHHSRQFYAAMWETIGRRGFWRGEIWNRHHAGGLRVQLLTISAVRGEGGAVSHYLGVFSDITQIKENEKQLERLAHYDALTGIPNRLLLADRLQQAIAQARRSGTVLAVCYLDLDEFKQVNDAFGHEAGDRLLVEVARRLQRAVRTGDTVARLGGDEFVFLLPGLDQLSECETIVERLIVDLTQPYSISGRSVSVLASVGIALFPKDGIEAETLMRHADEAMYVAKNAGGNGYGFYDPADRARD